MHKFIPVLALGALAFIFSPDVTMAAPPRADLGVTLQAPSSVMINTDTIYTATVKNFGPHTAQAATLTVEFPLTNTSPSVHILGTVSGLDTGCSIVANKLVCALGSIQKNKTKVITYTYKAPVSTKTLEMKAIAGSSTNDPNSSNNTVAFVPNLTYPALPIVSASVLNSHCTGTNLSAYFECTLFPSSISTHTVTLNSDTTITFTEPGYTGSWSQSSTSQLHFEYFDVGGKVAEFNGYAIDGSCFDGITTFFPPSTYMSAYRVCIQ